MADVSEGFYWSPKKRGEIDGYLSAGRPAGRTSCATTSRDRFGFAGAHDHDPSESKNHPKTQNTKKAPRIFRKNGWYFTDFDGMGVFLKAPLPSNPPSLVTRQMQ